MGRSGVAESAVRKTLNGSIQGFQKVINAEDD